MARGAPPVSLGAQAVRTIAAGPFLVTSARFPPGSVLPPHHHDRPILAVTLRGRWDSIVGRTTLDLAAGDVHVEPAGETHSNHFGAGPPHVVVIQPDPASADWLRPSARLLDTAASYRVPSASALGRRIDTEMRAPDDLTPLALQSTCLELLLRASRDGLAAADGRPPRWLQHVVDYMQAEYLGSPSLAALSRVAGVHPAHLTREFRRARHESPAAYLRRLRIEWSAARLRESGEAVASIAAAASFTDQSHFTRVFSRMMGVTPAAYRRLHRPRRADCPNTSRSCKTPNGSPA